MAIAIDETLIDSVTLPGVFPAKQDRSRAVVLRLVDAAISMLRSVDFDALAIADLCAEVGVTVGAFYSRFESKEVFLRFLQLVVVEDSRRRMLRELPAAARTSSDLAGFLERALHGSIVWYRKYEGLVRASLQHVHEAADGWMPMRELGRTKVEIALPIILEMLGKKDSGRVKQAVQFAFQMANGTLNNMILVNPGPYSIHDEETPKMLLQAMLLLIESAAVSRRH